MAGKGDKPRPTKKTQYNQNFEQIIWTIRNPECIKDVKKIKTKTRYIY
jgi:hypothetical protein